MTKKEALSAIKDHPGYNHIDSQLIDQVAFHMVATDCDVQTAVNEIGAGVNGWGRFE